MRGSEYFNYKAVLSIVLLAIFDAWYCFTLVDVGTYERDNDAQIFNTSEMGKAFINSEIDVPLPVAVNGFIHLMCLLQMTLSG